MKWEFLILIFFRDDYSAATDSYTIVPPLSRLYNLRRLQDGMMASYMACSLIDAFETSSTFLCRSLIK